MPDRDEHYEPIEGMPGYVQRVPNISPEKPFSAAGKPRVPWHVRRKDLEEAARTKRKRLESFQEIA